MAVHKNKLFYTIIVLIIVLAVLSRFLPLWFPTLEGAFNFSPFGAIALFGAAYFIRRQWAFIVPLAALWLTNLALNNIYYSEYFEGFTWFGAIEVYLAIAAVVLLGFWLLKKVTIANVVIASIGAAIVFFLNHQFSGMAKWYNVS